MAPVEAYHIVENHTLPHENEHDINDNVILGFLTLSQKW